MASENNVDGLIPILDVEEHLRSILLILPAASENNVDGLIPMPDFEEHPSKYDRLQEDIGDYEELTSCVKFQIVTYLAASFWYRKLNEEKKVECAMSFCEEYALKVVDDVVAKLGSWTRKEAEKFEGEKIMPYYEEILDAAAKAYCAKKSITYLGQDLEHPILLDWYKENAKNS